MCAPACPSFSSFRGFLLRVTRCRPIALPNTAARFIDTRNDDGREVVKPAERRLQSCIHAVADTRLGHNNGASEEHRFFPLGTASCGSAHHMTSFTVTGDSLVYPVSRSECCHLRFLGLVPEIRSSSYFHGNHAYCAHLSFWFFRAR